MGSNPIGRTKETLGILAMVVGGPNLGVGADGQRIDCKSIYWGFDSPLRLQGLQQAIEKKKALVDTWSVSTPFPLGRLKRHDSRSLQFPAKTLGTVKSVRHTHYGPVLSQGNLGSCTGNAMAQWLNCKPFHKPRMRHFTEEDAIRLYSAATVLDPWYGSYPPDDTGSSGLAVAKAAQSEGLISGYTWAFGLEHTLEALTISPVLIGTVWLHDMFYPDAKGFITASGEENGGHEYLLTGINLREKYVWALNSWSPLWGLNGRFKMTFETLDVLLNSGGDTIAPVI